MRYRCLLLGRLIILSFLLLTNVSNHRILIFFFLNDPPPPEISPLPLPDPLPICAPAASAAQPVSALTSGGFTAETRSSPRAAIRMPLGRWKFSSNVTLWRTAPQVASSTCSVKIGRAHV